MRSRQRPPSHHGPSPPARLAVARPTRRIFNCIVDESALVAGVKKSTRNGIRQWVKNGQIRLFVPLHALEELAQQKGGKNKHAEDVRETLQWLDEATTKHPNVVTLQGADETYERWAEVERFAVPRTLFSENDHELERDDDPMDSLDNTANRLTLSDPNAKTSASSAASDDSGSLSPSSMKSVRSSASPVSPPTSPAKAVVSPIQDLTSFTALNGRPHSSSASVPQPLQPLFNYILWRIHQETDPVAALETFIFLCNDHRKVNFAKGFDIKTKRLEQLREAIAREDRDFKNRQALLNRESMALSAAADGATVDEQSQIPALNKVSSPPKAPAAMLQQQQGNVIDPNAFSRGPQPPSGTLKDLPISTPKSPRNHPAPLNRNSPRSGHAVPFAPRGNMRGARSNARGSGRGRGNFGNSRGGFSNNPAIAETTENSSPNGQIDPDSFARPDPRGSYGGNRGSRKLWVPE